MNKDKHIKVNLNHQDTKGTKNSEEKILKAKQIQPYFRFS
jgi:hypothetical protein